MNVCMYDKLLHANNHILHTPYVCTCVYTYVFILHLFMRYVNWIISTSKTHSLLYIYILGLFFY